MGRVPFLYASQLFHNGWQFSEYNPKTYKKLGQVLNFVSPIHSNLSMTQYQ